LSLSAALLVMSRCPFPAGCHAFGVISSDALVL
jgi:hypothetical protein